MSSVLFAFCTGDVGQSVCQRLVAKEYDVVLAASATEALGSLRNLMVDGVIFDTAVPDMSAHDFRHWLRQDSRREHVPTVFLAPAALRWLPDALPTRIGRDRPVGKPFLCSEVGQTLRRLPGWPRTPIPKILTVGDPLLYRSLFVLSGEGSSVTPTCTGFRLTGNIMERSATVVTAEELLERIWGFLPHTGSVDIVRSHMRNQRRVSDKVSRGREVIRTVRRRGYRLSA